MAAKPVVSKVTKASKGDRESKGQKASGMKRTSIGRSKNSRAKSKDAVRNRKGR